MKADISLFVEIPEDVSIVLGNEITVKCKDKELSQKILLNKLELRQEGNKLFVEAKKGSKREKKLAGTIAGLISNMIKGVREGFTYKLQVASSHFPMRVDIDASKGIFTVKNYLGERIPRTADILPGVDVLVKGDIITVTSMDKQAAGQTASNIEGTTKVKAKDKRIFQDGIYLVEKGK